MVTVANLGMPCGGRAAGLAGELDGERRGDGSCGVRRAGACSWSEGRAGVSAGQCLAKLSNWMSLPPEQRQRGPWPWGGLHWHSRNC